MKCLELVTTIEMLKSCLSCVLLARASLVYKSKPDDEQQDTHGALWKNTLARLVTAMSRRRSRSVRDDSNESTPADSAEVLLAGECLWCIWEYETAQDREPSKQSDRSTVEFFRLQDADWSESPFPRDLIEALTLHCASWEDYYTARLQTGHRMMRRILDSTEETDLWHRDHDRSEENDLWHRDYDRSDRRDEIDDDESLYPRTLRSVAVSEP